MNKMVHTIEHKHFLSESQHLGFFDTFRNVCSVTCYIYFVNIFNSRTHFSAKLLFNKGQVLFALHPRGSGVFPIVVLRCLKRGKSFASQNYFPT